MNWTRYFKTKPSLTAAHTWHEKLISHEVERNSFHATGKLKASREFADAVMHLENQVKTVRLAHIKPVVIYQHQKLSEKPLSTFM